MNGDKLSHLALLNDTAGSKLLLARWLDVEHVTPDFHACVLFGLAPCEQEKSRLFYRTAEQNRVGNFLAKSALVGVLECVKQILLAAESMTAHAQRRDPARFERVRRLVFMLSQGGTGAWRQGTVPRIIRRLKLHSCPGLVFFLRDALKQRELQAPHVFALSRDEGKSAPLC